MPIKETFRTTLDELEVEWTIQHFFSLPKNVDYFLDSPEFNFCGAPWYLCIYPNGQSNDEFKGQIGLYLHRGNSGKSLKVTYWFSLKTVDGSDVGDTEDLIHSFFRKDHGFGIRSFLRKSELKKRKHELLPDGTLTVFCSLKCKHSCQNVSGREIALLTEGKIGVEISTQTEKDEEDAKAKADNDNNVAVETSTQTELGENSKINSGHDAVLETGTQTEELSLKVLENEDDVSCQHLGNSHSEDIIKLQEELKELLHSGKNSDVTLQVKGKTFEAHRNILSARCPVFAAMMEHTMQEKSTGVVTIEDCDPDTFPDFLHYLYTGRVENLISKDVPSLYNTADKYQVDRLKKICLKHMQNNISADNFCDIITLSLWHEEKELSEVATQFFVENSMAIVLTAKWQVFLEENPTVSNELFIKMLQAKA